MSRLDEIKKRKNMGYPQTHFSKSQMISDINYLISQVESLKIQLSKGEVKKEKILKVQDDTFLKGEEKKKKKVKVVSKRKAIPRVPDLEDDLEHEIIEEKPKYFIGIDPARKEKEE